MITHTFCVPFAWFYSINNHHHKKQQRVKVAEKQRQQWRRKRDKKHLSGIVMMQCCVISNVCIWIFVMWIILCVREKSFQEFLLFIVSNVGGRIFSHSGWCGFGLIIIVNLIYYTNVTSTESFFLFQPFR